MKIALLDTNVLLALAWPNHQHHGAASKWFRAEALHGWATCGVTQLGFVRISSNRAFSSAAVSPTEASALLQKWIAHPKHVFWRSPGADDPQIFKHALGHQQVADAWLIHVAEKNGGCFVTFDSRSAAHARDRRAVLILSP